MADYVNEQEQVEEIKKWLRENAAAVVVGLILGISAISGWRYWQAKERARAESASALFTQVIAANINNQAAQAEKVAQQIISDYGNTTYGSYAALMLAKLAVDKQDLQGARQQLNWVLEHGSDAALKRLAMLRLARVALAQGKPDEALAQLDKLPSSQIASAEVAELRGDILMAQGKKDEAGKQYLNAYANVEPAERSNESSTLALKLDDLGLTPPPAAGEKVISP
ncbi:MAG: tetratricopeptide repeat protein [Gammaproteobacteria bacterium]